MLVLEETTNKYTKGCIEHDDIFSIEQFWPGQLVHEFYFFYHVTYKKGIEKIIPHALLIKIEEKYV